MPKNSNTGSKPQCVQTDVSVSAFLNGKAKQSFLDYYWRNYIGKTRFLNEKSETEEFFESLYPTLKNALIIDFFDSVGIFIIIQKLVYEPLFDVHVNGLKNQITSGSFDTRDEATKEAIRIANELYNAQVE